MVNKAPLGFHVLSLRHTDCLQPQDCNSHKSLQQKFATSKTGMAPQARNNPVIFLMGQTLSLCIQCQFCNEQQAQAGRTTICGGPEMLYLLHFFHLMKNNMKTCEAMDQLFNCPTQVHLITQHAFQISTDQERCLPVELNSETEMLRQTSPPNTLLLTRI